MREGDVVLASRGNRKVQAVGLVAGPYEVRHREDGYHHRRAVRWTGKDETGEGIDVAGLYGRSFTMRRIYRLDAAQVSWEKLRSHLDPADDGPPPPHVLIVDEINRANVSKVPGEAITLLEEDERLGDPALVRGLFVVLCGSGGVGDAAARAREAGAGVGSALDQVEAVDLGLGPPAAPGRRERGAHRGPIVFEPRGEGLHDRGGARAPRRAGPRWPRGDRCAARRTERRFAAHEGGEASRGIGHPRVLARGTALGRGSPRRRRSRRRFSRRHAGVGRGGGRLRAREGVADGQASGPARTPRPGPPGEERMPAVRGLKGARRPRRHGPRGL